MLHLTLNLACNIHSTNCTERFVTILQSQVWQQRSDRSAVIKWPMSMRGKLQSKPLQEHVSHSVIETSSGEWSALRIWCLCDNIPCTTVLSFIHLSVSNVFCFCYLGYKETQISTLDCLADLVCHYIHSISANTLECSENSGRVHPGIQDVMSVLGDMVSPFMYLYLYRFLLILTAFI